MNLRRAAFVSTLVAQVVSSRLTAKLALDRFFPFILDRGLIDGNWPSQKRFSK
jgi:hypothetical protein